MRITLAQLLAKAVTEMKVIKDNLDSQTYMEWVSRYQAQIVVLAVQIAWSEDVESALQQSDVPKALEQALINVEATLEILCVSVLGEQPPLQRKKLEHLVRRTVVTNLILLFLQVWIGKLTGKNFRRFKFLS